MYRTAVLVEVFALPVPKHCRATTETYTCSKNLT